MGQRARLPSTNTQTPGRTLSEVGEVDLDREVGLRAVLGVVGQAEAAGRPLRPACPLLRLIGWTWAVDPRPPSGRASSQPAGGSGLATESAPVPRRAVLGGAEHKSESCRRAGGQ